MKKVMTLFVRTSGGDIPYDLTINPSAEDSAVAGESVDIKTDAAVSLSSHNDTIRALQAKVATLTYINKEHTLVLDSQNTIIQDLDNTVEMQKQEIERLSQMNTSLNNVLSGTEIKLQAFLPRVNEMRVGVSTQVPTADSAKSLLPVSSSEEEELCSGSAYSADDYDDPSKGRSQSPNIFKRGSALPGMRGRRLPSSPSF